MAAARFVCLLIMGTMFLLNMGVFAGGLFAFGACASELWMALVSRPPAGGQRASAGLRLNRLGCLVCVGALWSSMSLAYWESGSGPLRTCALVLLSTILLVARSNSFRSKLAFVALGSPAAITLLFIATQVKWAAPVAILTMAFGVAVALLYLLHDAQQNLAILTALRSTQAELQRQTAAAISANEAKSAFLAMMSHELRTPMNGVLGMTRALSQTELNQRQSDYVGMLLSSGEGLMTILNDILDISKIEAGKLTLETIPFELRKIGQEAHDLWGELARAKGVKLTYDFDGPEWVIGDPTRIRQIMMNLLSNALKFTKSGEVRLSIRFAAAAGVEISISDTGPGISEETQSRLFQSFAQANASTARKFGGTGLGLAICKQLAELMGGSIALESEVGKGSIFSVIAPLALGAAQAVEDLKSEEVSLAGLLVLVADDNPVNQAVAKAILDAAQIEIISAMDGVEVLDRLRTMAFDVVLMDVHMPNMDGVEALRRIRAGEAGPVNIPIIALTADAMAGANERLLEAGFDAVQPKPINPADLFAAIAHACAEGRTRPQSMSDMVILGQP
jgi:signal transduction histidine kinase/AmiR/NasT family two-component response regulator